MLFTLRGIHISFWLFVFWVFLRFWEMRFEVSPLPAWTLPAFVLLVLFGVSVLLSHRLQKRHPLDKKSVLWATVLLVLGTFAWESGLTLYLAGWSGFGNMFTWRFVAGLAIQAVAGFVAAAWLRRTRPPATLPDAVPVSVSAPDAPPQPYSEAGTRW